MVFSVMHLNPGKPNFTLHSSDICGIITLTIVICHFLLPLESAVRLSLCTSIHCTAISIRHYLPHFEVLELISYGSQTRSTSIKHVHCMSKFCWWHWEHCILNALLQHGLLLRTLSFNTAHKYRLTAWVQMWWRRPQPHAHCHQNTL